MNSAQRETEAAIDDLRAALADLGVTLPGLGIDVVSVSAGYPVAQLGLAPAETLHQIAAGLRGQGLVP